VPSREVRHYEDFQVVTNECGVRWR
jgi:hypothetical protein